MIKGLDLLEISGAAMDRQRVPSNIVVSLRLGVPETAVDDGHDPGVAEITDQSADSLLEFNNHFWNPDIHHGVLGNGGLILNNRIGYREWQAEDDKIG